eukprot:g2008.t1
MTFDKVVVIDARAHMLGRLSSIVAKEMLRGQKVVVVRCEGLNISGSLYRNKIIFHRFLRKRTLTNPKRGPIHYRAPSKILWRTIRGMIPHKTVRGAAAMQRLQTFDGIPKPFDQMKRMVVPNALRVNRLKNGRKFCVLGDLAHGVGWKHQALVGRLEDKRKTRSAAFFEQKKAKVAIRAKAVKMAEAD